MTEDSTADREKKILRQSLFNSFVICTVCYLIITKVLFSLVCKLEREAPSTVQVMNIAPYLQLLTRLHYVVLNSAHQKPCNFLIVVRWNQIKLKEMGF